MSFARRRIVPCPICGIVALVVTTIRGVIGARRHVLWSRMVCLRGHRSVTAGAERGRHMTSYGIAEPLLELIKRGVRDVLREEWSARPPIQPRLLDAKQAGAYLSRPESMVRKLAREKRIRVSSSDSRILFDRLDLDNFIECERDAGHAG